MGSDRLAFCESLLRRFVRLRAARAPPAVRGAAAQGWASRWWGVLAVAVQRAVCSAVLGRWTMPALPMAEAPVPLADILAQAPEAPPSRLGMR